MSKTNLNPNQLNEYLNQVIPPDGTPLLKTDDDPLVDAALHLANQKHPAPSIETAVAIQQQLLAAFAKPQPIIQHKSLFRLPVRSLAVAASFILILSTIIVQPIAAASIPGDLFYPAKRAFEHVELTVANITGNKASTRMKFAQRRADEVLALLNENTLSPSLISEAVDELAWAEEAVSQDSDSDSVELVGRTLQVHVTLNYAIAESYQRGLADEVTYINLKEIIEAAANNSGFLAAAEQPTSAPSVIPLILATPVLTVEQTSEPTPVPLKAFVIAANTINVRNGPGIDFDVDIQLEPGTSVHIIGANEDASWLHIRLPNGNEGWVAAWLIYIGETLPRNERPNARQSPPIPNDPSQTGGFQNNPPAIITPEPPTSNGAQNQKNPAPVNRP